MIAPVVTVTAVAPDPWVDLLAACTRVGEALQSMADTIVTAMTVWWKGLREALQRGLRGRELRRSPSTTPTPPAARRSARRRSRWLLREMRRA